MSQVGNISLKQLFNGLYLGVITQGVGKNLVQSVEGFTEPEMGAKPPAEIASDILNAELKGGVPDFRNVTPTIEIDERGSQKPGHWVIAYHYPYTGNQAFFSYNIVDKDFDPIYADHSDKDLILHFEISGDNSTSQYLKSLPLEKLAHINDVLDSMRSTVNAWSRKTYDEVLQAVEARKRMFEMRRTAMAGSGFAIRSRDGAPTVFQPVVKEKILPAPPKTTSPLELDPILHEGQYKHILGLISQMGRVVELAPSAFHGIGEEALRFVLLVPLNTHYEGEAKAEAFSKQGKTDIHIQHKGASVFVAECKFWDGPQQFLDTINQLLGYTTWRDAKTAIIMFNEAGNTTKRIKTIKEATKKHPNFVSLDEEEGTMLRYTMKSASDPDKNFTMTVMVFDVPSPPAPIPKIPKAKLAKANASSVAPDPSAATTKATDLSAQAT